MAKKVVKVSAIQQRRDTVANWTTKNPILLDGEQITVYFPDGSVRHKTGHDGKNYNELSWDNIEIVVDAKLYEKIFTISEWNNNVLVIPASEHLLDISNKNILAKVYMLSNGAYSEQCFAAMDTTVSVNEDKSVILSYDGSPYSGRVILIG